MRKPARKYGYRTGGTRGRRRPSAGVPAGAQLSCRRTVAPIGTPKSPPIKRRSMGFLVVGDEVTNLRAARTRDREQIAETMVGLLRH